MQAVSQKNCIACLNTKVYTINEKNSEKKIKINEILYNDSCMATSYTGFAIFTKIREKLLKFGGICGIIVNRLF